jgi:hypothetical protein
MEGGKGKKGSSQYQLRQSPIGPLQRDGLPVGLRGNNLRKEKSLEIGALARDWLSTPVNSGSIFQYTRSLRTLPLHLSDSATAGADPGQISTGIPFYGIDG